MTEALGVASSVIAVVDLSAKVFSLCLQYSREVKNAKDDIDRLHKEITAFQNTSEKLKVLLEEPRGRELRTSRQLLSVIEDAHSTLGQLEHRLRPSTGRKTMRRFGVRALKWPFESKDVEGAIQNLERCRENISLALNIDQTVILQNVNDRTILSQLPVADGASFDSRAEEHNPTCLPDTREELLREIDHWINNPKSKTIFWLNGKAGTGKSTISRTVAWSRSRQGDLGASFFFKRGEVDRGNLSKFVSTVARRLAWSTPAVASFIKSAVNADPEIADKAVREQFKKLVREPLSKATLTSLYLPSVVIVVDALDECERDADITLILQLFSNLRFAGPLRVRVLVTSRPELPVRLGFSSIGNAHQDLVLHKIPLPIVEHDISVFLRHEFANIRNNFNRDAVEELKLRMDWPGEANLGNLTRAAVPLFIFAATLCRFINDRYLGSPDELLQSVLNAAGTGQGSKLDMTYSPVLSQQVLNRSGSERLDIIESFRLIVGAIVTLANPLSMRALALLLDVHVSKVTTRLSALHSVLDIPETLDGPVRLLHLSFRDYLVGLEERELVELRVDERHTHQSLAKHCLRIMRGGLRKNICGLSFPGMRRSTMNTGQLEKSMPSYLQYACMHWAYHHMKCNSGHDIENEVYDFLTTHFLHWLEAMSLLGRVRDCLESLRLLAKWSESREGSSLSTFVADAVRFAQTFFPVLDEAPLQVYCCLVFAPSESIVRKTFEKCVPRLIQHWPKVQRNWDVYLLAIETHSGIGLSVVLSHDSKKVALGCSYKIIRICNTVTGGFELDLEGHKGVVMSVVFSHDSKWVASGSLDKTIRIWDAGTSECEDVVLFDGYADVISFTPDGRGIVTDRCIFPRPGGSQSGPSSTMLLQPWDASTLACTDNTWVTAAGDDLLWLPSECRNGNVAISGSRVAIGCPSGRVLVLGVSIADMD